jgi:probable F420-dependent oxidoreductase
MAEALQIVKALLSAAPLTYEGRFYRMNGLTGAAKPMQQPHPPVLIGGGGRRLLTLAAKEADIISVMPRSRRDGSGLEDADASPEVFTQKLGWIRDAAGDRFSAIELNTLAQTVVITDDSRGAAAPLAKEYGMDVDKMLESPLVLIGSADQIAQALQQRRERFGISYITVFEKDLENMAKVIGRVGR